MKIIKISNFDDQGLIATKDGLQSYFTDENEVLSGVAPVVGDNIRIENNEFVHVTIGVHAHNFGTANLFDIVNNTFFNCVTNGILVSGALTYSYVNNNILHGNGTVNAYTNTGINITTVGAGSYNAYNDVYDFSTLYGGQAAAGTGSLNVDPLFKEIPEENFLLSVNSPCLDTGGSTGPVPSIDKRGVSRPQILPGITGSGYDMGAFEMLYDELYTSYYINASGSGVPPYDSSATGAVNFGNLINNVTFNIYDSIKVIQEGGVIDDSTNVISPIDKSIFILSDSSNTSKPSISVNNDLPLFSFVAGAVSPVVRDLSLSKPGPDATSNFINFADYELTAPEVSGCGFSVQNTSGANARGIVFSDNTISSSGIIKGNSFDDLTDGVYSEAPELSGVAVKADYYAQMMNQ